MKQTIKREMRNQKSSKIARTPSSRTNVLYQYDIQAHFSSMLSAIFAAHTKNIYLATAIV